MKMIRTTRTATLIATTIASMQSGMPRRTTTMKDSHIPNLKYLRSHFFRGYIDTSWVESQEKFHRDSRHDTQKFTGKQCASQVPMAGRSRGLASTMYGITRQRGRDPDGKRNARTPSKNPGNVQQCSFTEHTRQANFRQPN
jgi:hypothetical protein